MRINWTKEMESDLIRLRHSGKTWKQIPKEMAKLHEGKFTYDSCRQKYRSLNKELPIEKVKDDIVKPFKEEVKINSDGTHISDKLIELSDEEMKDTNAVLLAHGYDPSEWELTSSQSSMWHHFNKEMSNPRTLYASKIKVKPKGYKLNTNELLEIVKQTPKITYRPKVNKNTNKYLLLSLYDMHFGIADYKYYMPTQAKILEKLKNSYKEVLLVVGQDAFHNDDFRGRTSSGRQIEQVDMVKAWKDATLFFEPIIKESLERNSKVSIVYSKGNHSETIEWAFVQYLKARYPQCQVDDSLKERKTHMLGNNFIGMNHGDKKNEKRLPENFATEFPLEWSKATTRTVFTGHRHHEMVIDIGGVLVRRMPTRNETDQWHEDMGYTTSHKRFQIHEFSEDEQLASYYV